MTQTRRTTLTALAALLAAPALAGLRSSQEATALTPAELTTRAREALAPGGRIEALIDELAADGRFSGAVLGAVEGKPLLTKAWGQADRATGAPNTADTRFNMASMGKLFTTVGVAQLMEAGKLALNDRLAAHLPDVNPAIADVTIEQLLTHSSGLGSYFAAPGWNERRAAIRTLADYRAMIDERPQFTPGERYEYSNSGFILLGAVIERLTGQDFYTAMQERVFGPAGMTRTGYPTLEETDLAVPYTNGCFARPPSVCTPGDWVDARPTSGVRGGPAGGGASTVRDLHAFAEALKTGRLIRSETLALFTAERGKMTRQGGPIDAYGLGFGRQTVHGLPTWGHNGGTPGSGWVRP
jgi:D-alanyl-D-alanine carboxypeptidase